MKVHFLREDENYVSLCGYTMVAGSTSSPIIDQVRDVTCQRCLRVLRRMVRKEKEDQHDPT